MGAERGEMAAGDDGTGADDGDAAARRGQGHTAPGVRRTECEHTQKALAPYEVTLGAGDCQDNPRAGRFAGTGGDEGKTGATSPSAALRGVTSGHLRGSS
ncbi:hypothetical protein GCM10010339_57060 [Streptomyces alanosinicus]|uniref:Uncharacterized protein n=1 Tax=Streptomyces alanosinicus TaxID=68171 RepID=A0A918YLN6_9ACTN|nr:hypothetical protein GCM10010339_57060 [Streptomyces alanosinicus]